MTTINAHKLRRLIKQVRAHISTDETLSPINGIRFDCDGVHIHALGTDRYTMAVSRAKVREETEPWALTIAEKDLVWFDKWLKTHNGDTILSLAAVGDGLVISGDRGNLTVPASNPFFPKWQGLFRAALEDASTATELVALNAAFLARWESAGGNLRVWHTEPTNPFLIVGEDFLGLQMPMAHRGDDKTRESVLGQWAGTLGDSPEVVATAPLPEPGAVAELAEDLLKQTLRSTSDLFAAATGDASALTAYALAGGRAWAAYRLLQALKAADPDLAEKTVRDLTEELESGEIGEWAWDEAAGSGHDPQKWHDDYEAHLKALAAKKSAPTS